jgi:hypothetical protein
MTDTKNGVSGVADLTIALGTPYQLATVKLVRK